MLHEPRQVQQLNAATDVVASQVTAKAMRDVAEPRCADPTHARGHQVEVLACGTFLKLDGLCRSSG